MKITNPTANRQTIKADTALGSIAFELVWNLSQCNNIVTHLHEHIDGSIAMCSMKSAECPIHHLMENEHAAVQLANVKIYTLTSHNHYPTCAESHTYIHT